MSWAVVARKDFEDAVRSRMLWGIVALFAGLIALSVFVPSLLSDDLSVITGYGVATEFAKTLVPITALVAAYLAIAGERESGSIKILLGAPHSRSDVTLGKLVGRSGVVVVGVVAGFLVAGAVGALVYGELPVIKFLSVTALTALLGVAFVGIAVGISAATSTRSRAMALAIGVFFVFALLWDLVSLGLTYLRTGSLPVPGATVPAWQLLVERLNPSAAFGQLVNSVLEAGSNAATGQAGGQAGGIAAQVSGPVPFYLQDWFMFVLLAAWVVVPVVLGHLRFQRTDL
ncbi:ABC transporter permease subunit [Halorussus halophilus]|uniref:ABC transporter permease subunit n=1 Tax=Halorussus halophilus TaxID=2650975 RepID=UPI0013016307|nr:ABC transporter permease subunit [Halorussus halophilus]